MTDWSDIMWMISVACALAGGGVSLLAFCRNRMARPRAEAERSVRATYLVSYILMSLSIFFLALGSFLR